MLPSRLDPTILPMRPISSSAAHVPHTRRRFLGAVAGVAGAGLAATLLPVPALAAAGGTPKPIPGGLTFGEVTFHVNGFGLDADPITVTDFNGLVGVCDVQGTGTATNADGSTETLLFDTDMRFMQGEYVGADGRNHHGTFGFV